MIDTEEKRYIADLCSAVYGYVPKDVVASQIRLSFTIATGYSVTDDVVLDRPFFLKSVWFAHSKKVSGMQNFMCFGVSSTSKTMQLFDSKEFFMLGNHVKVTSSEAGDVDLLLTGYECVM